jgi:hypothetical protein
MHKPDKAYFEKLYELCDLSLGEFKPARIDLCRTTSIVLEPQKTEVLFSI